MVLKLTAMDVRAVLQDTGTIFGWVSLSFALPIFFALLYREPKTVAITYLLAGLVVFLLGHVLKRAFRFERETELKHAFLTVTIVWVFFAGFAAIPFVLSQGMSFVDSYFEAMSALTTTGLTMMEQELDSAPKSLIFWRSLLSWIGGVGIVILGVMGVFATYTKVSKLIVAEGMEQRIRPNFKNTVKEIWKLYAVFSFVGFILLYLLGLDFFDALNYAMSALPTSGLGINSAGLSGLDNVLAELVIAFLMFLGATNFLVFYLFFKKGNASAFRNDPEFRTLIILIIFSTLLVSPKLIQFYGSEFQGIYVGFFTTVSAISEGGFQNTPISDTAAWDDFVKLVLVGLMIIGGGTASTSGGLKLSRFILSIKSLQWKIKGLFLPRGAFFKKQFEGTSIEEEKLKEINHFIILYAFGIIGGVMILTSQGFPLNNALFEVASAQGNAGLSSGITSIGMPFLSKITLIANMLIGRLEFIPFIAAAGFGLSFLRKA